MSNPLRFPDWYYGGPFLRVDNPDRDLPRRDTSAPISEAMRAQVEFDGMRDGERLIAPFNDANGIDEMLAPLELIADYPDKWSDDQRWVYPTVQAEIAWVKLRLETKLAHRPGRTRSNWFREALVRVDRLSSLVADGNYREASELALAARDLISQGNRASRRKVSFVVGPDGKARKL